MELQVPKCVHSEVAKSSLDACLQPTWTGLRTGRCHAQMRQQQGPGACRDRTADYPHLVTILARWEDAATVLAFAHRYATRRRQRDVARLGSAEGIPLRSLRPHTPVVTARCYRIRGTRQRYDKMRYSLTFLSLPYGHAPAVRSPLSTRCTPSATAPRLRPRQEGRAPGGGVWCCGGRAI